ncbi:MAG: HEAT repeat domain-containing protein, partial [Planctomycetia bacterium]|nr:HEAT repeat domain-containing protein [Planctomycetia bacterium]
MIKFAESASGAFIFSNWDKLEFLFLDHDGTDQSVAAKFWPRFRELITQNHSGFDPSNMPHRWEYLRRLEPLPTIDMYFNCWLDMKPDTHLSHDINQIVGRIPKEKSLPLLRKIIDRLEAELATITDKNASRSYQLKNQLGTWTTISDELSLTVAERFARYCEQGNPYASRELLNRPFDDPLFAQLVESPSAKARLAFVNFLKTQPTPRHREWLTKLSTDPDKSVSTAATEVIESLKAQSNDPPPKRKFSPPAAKIGDVTFEEPPLTKE